MLKVRNPWGKQEWKGDWGAKSEVRGADSCCHLCHRSRSSDPNPRPLRARRSAQLWTRSLGSALGRTRQDDGEFWMSWHDFLCRFNVVDVCKFHRGWQAMSIDSDLGISAAAAGSLPAFEVQVGPALCPSSPKP